MDLDQFMSRVEELFEKESIKVNFGISKPSVQLLDQYGPLCDRVTKEESINMAIEIWQKYFLDLHLRHQSHHP